MVAVTCRKVANHPSDTDFPSQLLRPRCRRRVSDLWWRKLPLTPVGRQRQTDYGPHGELGEYRRRLGWAEGQSRAPVVRPRAGGGVYTRDPSPLSPPPARPSPPAHHLLPFWPLCPTPLPASWRPGRGDTGGAGGGLASLRSLGARRECCVWGNKQAGSDGRHVDTAVPTWGRTWGREGEIMSGAPLSSTCLPPPPPPPTVPDLPAPVPTSQPSCHASRGRPHMLRGVAGTHRAASNQVVMLGTAGHDATGTASDANTPAAQGGAGARPATPADLTRLIPPRHEQLSRFIEGV